MWARTLANCVPMGLSSAPLTWACHARQRATRQRMGPPKEAPPLLVTAESPSEEYGRGPWASASGPATGRFGAEAFVLQENGTLRCPAGSSLWRSSLRQENAFTQRSVYAGFPSDCRACELREQCLGRGARGNRARRKSRVRRLLPTPSSLEPQTGVLSATRLSWMWQLAPFAALGRPIGVGNTLRCCP